MLVCFVRLGEGMTDSMNTHSTDACTTEGAHTQIVVLGQINAVHMNGVHTQL